MGPVAAAGACRRTQLVGRDKVLGIDENVAGVDKRARGRFLADPHDENSLFANPRRQARIIAVARNEAESVDRSRIKNIHRVDNHRRVGRVFTDRITELLNRLNRVDLERIFPAAHIRGRPVPVDAPNRDHSVFRRLRQDFIDERRLRVVAVDEHGDALRRRDVGDIFDSET